MTKAGYVQVLVSTVVYERLKTVALENGLSLGKAIAKLLDNPSIDTRIDTTTKIGHNQRTIQFLGPKMDQNLTSFAKKEGVGTLVPSLAGPAGFEPATTDSGGQRHILVIPAFPYVGYVPLDDCRLDHGPDMNRRTTNNKTC